MAHLRPAVPDPDLQNAAIILTGNTFGYQIKIEVGEVELAAKNSDGASMDVTINQAARFGKRGFDTTDPPTFSDVVSTPRLTWQQAVLLAQKSVFRCYRVRNLDASGGGPINVPGYGPILRRQQLLLTDTQVDQITPELPNPQYSRDDQQLDPNTVNADGATVPFSEDFIENFYNGYSRDKPAVVYGSFCPENSGVSYKNEYYGTTIGYERVFVDFSIAGDARWQVITFATPVYRYVGNRVVPGNLTLQTGCYLRDNITNQFVVFSLSRLLRPNPLTTFYETQTHLDVQLGVVGEYQFTPSAITLLDSGQSQQSAITFTNLIPNALIGAAYIWTVSLKGVEYAYTNANTDTPLIVANHFLGVLGALFPRTGVGVTLMTAAPPNVLPPFQNAGSPRSR